jgi:hypothetical protein
MKSTVTAKWNPQDLSVAAVTQDGTVLARWDCQQVHAVIMGCPKLRGAKTVASRLRGVERELIKQATCVA